MQREQIYNKTSNYVWDYILVACLLTNEITTEGLCKGHAYMGMQALMSIDLNSFIRRIFIIHHGLPHHSQNRIITLQDLKELVVKLNLEKYISQEMEITSEPSQIEMKTENDLAEIHFEAHYPGKAEFEKLVKEVANKSEKSQNIYPESYASPQCITLTNLPSGINSIHPNTICNQIEYAEDIKLAVIERELKECNNRSDKEIVLISFLNELIELKTYFANLALYQNLDKFQYLFPSESVDYNTALSMLNPTCLDKKAQNILEIKGFVNQYTGKEIQIYFEHLKKQVIDKNFMNYESEIPFVIILTCARHVITVGYHNKINKWILIDSNQPVLTVNLDKIGLEITKAFLKLSAKTFSDRFFKANLFFWPSKKQWYILDLEKREPNPCNDDSLSKLIGLGVLKSLDESDIRLNIYTSFYSLNIHTQAVKTSLHNCHEISSINDMHTLSLYKCDYLDDLRGESLFKFACFNGDINCVTGLQKIKDCITNEKDIGNILVQTILKRHLNVAYYLLKNGVNSNICDVDNFTPLLAACQSGNITLVKILLQLGANIHHESNKGATPILAAAGFDNSSMIKLLCEHKGNVNQESKNLFNSTPLHIAVSDNKLNAVRTLIEMKADVNKIFSKGYSSVFQAVSNNNNDILELLLNANAKMDTYNYHLGWKKLQGYSKLKNLPNNCIQIDSNHLHGGILIIMSLSKMNYDMTLLLIKRGANLATAIKIAQLFHLDHLQEDFLLFNTQYQSEQAQPITHNPFTTFQSKKRKLDNNDITDKDGSKYNTVKRQKT